MTERKPGRRLTLREKIAVRFISGKRTRKKADPESARRTGITAMMAGIGSILFLLLRATAPLTPFMALTAVIFGAISLHQKKEKNTPAVIGLVLGSGYIIILLLAIAALNRSI